MSSPFSQFIDKLTGGRHIPKNDVYMPDWNMVTRKTEILAEMRNSGEQQAKHACTCRASDCELHFTAEPTWLTVEYFLSFVTFSLMASQKALKDNGDDSSKEAVETIDIYVRQWATMSPETVLNDPRYRAFEVGFNGQLTDFIMQHYSFRVPKH